MKKESKIEKPKTEKEETIEVVQTKLNDILKSIREDDRDKGYLPERIAAELRFNQKTEIDDLNTEVENFLKSQSLTEEEKTEFNQILDNIRRGLTTDKAGYISHLRSIAEWEGTEEPRDKVVGVIQAHLNNALVLIWDREEFSEEFNEELKDVADNAKNHKLTSKEYEQILNYTLKITPEDKKEKIAKALGDLKTMIFVQEQEK